MTKNIFLFWLGSTENDQLSEQKKKLTDLGFNVIVGPSTDDHQYLIENSAFYRNSFNNKIWSYCSDVWRVFILSKNIGMYMDVNTQIGKKFNEFYEAAISNNTYLIRNNYAFIDGPVLASGVEENEFFKNCIDIYFNQPDRHIRTVYYAGDIISYVARKNGIGNSWDIINKNNIYVDKILNIRNKETIYKVSTNSWKSGSEANHDGMQDVIDKWNRGFISKTCIFNAKIIDKYGINAINSGMLRYAFKHSSNKSEKMELLSLYKNKGYRVPMNRWLLWDRIWCIFN